MVGLGKKNTMSNPPINASFAASASSTGAISGNMSRIFGDTIIGKKPLPWWAWLIVGGIVLILVLAAFVLALAKWRSK